jgi:hypothetical protein
MLEVSSIGCIVPVLGVRECWPFLIAERNPLQRFPGFKPVMTF